MFGNPPLKKKTPIKTILAQTMLTLGAPWLCSAAVGLRCLEAPGVATLGPSRAARAQEADGRGRSGEVAAEWGGRNDFFFAKGLREKHNRAPEIKGFLNGFGI